MKTTEEIKQEREEFEKVVMPVIEYLNDTKFHPHMTVIIDNTRAELVEGRMSTRTEKYWKD